MNWQTLYRRWMDDPAFRQEWEELGPVFEVYRALLAVRQRRGWTQGEMAKRLGVTQPYIAKLESGRQNITLRQLARVAAALGCRLRIEFVDDEGTVEVEPGSEASTGRHAPGLWTAALTFTPGREGF